MRKMKDSGIALIGEIPEHWNVRRLRYVGGCQNGISKGGDFFGSGYPFVTYSDVYKNMLLPEKPSGLVESSETERKYYSVEKGDIFFTRTSETIEEIGFTSVCVKSVKNATFAGFLIRVRPFKNIIFDGFSKYYFRSDIHRNFFVKEMNLVIRASLGQELLKKLPVILPPWDEQQRIADYLDAQCAKIDSTIAKTQQIIEKLKAYRQSVITEAVTKGLNPDAPMKDSGIEWIGEIPEHWKVVPLTKQLESIVDYRGKTPEKVDEGVFLITAKNIKQGKINYEISQEYIRPEEYEEIMRRGKPAIGDVLFTTEAPLGEVANIDNENIALAQRVIKFRPLSSLNSFFLKYWIMGQGFQQFLTTLSTGSTATGIKASKLFAFRIADAPLQEQQEIVSYLDDKCAKIDEYISKKQEVIEKLTAYKKSLIFEVVTGKKEI